MSYRMATELDQVPSLGGRAAMASARVFALKSLRARLVIQISGAGSERLAIAAAPAS
jgi:hypothetical protein